MQNNKNQFSILLFILFFISTLSYGQECNCEDNFEWTKKTFEENDAGFQYAIDRKGIAAYKSHNTIYLEKAKTTIKKVNCTELLYEWMTFFRAGHIGIIPTTESTSEDSNIEKWETVDIDFSKFEKYINEKKEAGYEGIWQLDSYKIGIKKEGENYIGFIIEAEAQNWKKGEIKLRINKENEGIKSIFYLRNKSKREFETVKLLGKNYLKMGGFYLKRLNSKFPIDEAIVSFVKYISSEKPFVEELNETTIVLRVPTFSSYAKKDIDSVIAFYKEKILKTENLIIDLRNNGGGSDYSYKEILPFIYTNPIRTVGVELLSTKLNNQRMLDFVNEPKYGFDEEQKKWAKESFEKLDKNLNQFVNLNDSVVSTNVLGVIHENPKNVAIIIHEKNGSTTEQFLLAAKQSKKVKLFGTTTFGVLDISNMYFVKSPCEEFELGYSLSKSMRIPEMAIDSKGIQPDFYIDKSIPDYKWLQFVNKIMNTK